MTEPRLYQSLTLSEALSRIQGNCPTLILLHRHPDGDAIGSAFALKRLLEAMGGRVFCVCEDEIPEQLRFLTTGLQDSILRSRLPSNFLPSQVISVDTASPLQVGTLYPEYEGRFDLMIDHHARGEMYADGYIDGEASSAGEVIFRLSRELLRTGRLTSLPPEVDRLLYAAISSDTGCFRYSNTTPETHRVAAVLLEACPDAAEINHRLFGVKSYKLLQAEMLGFERLRLFADGRLGIVDMPHALIEAHGFTGDHLGTLVDVARGLEGVQVAVAIRQPSPEGVYRVSMRSSCRVDVAAICASMGGGGHVKAAGCTLLCEGGMEEVIERVSSAILPHL